MGGSKVITSVVFEAGLWLVEEDSPLDVVREIIYRMMVYSRVCVCLEVEEDCGSLSCQGDGWEA
jgi:hypothetical protein